jgi:AraC family transcriptional regulator of adaptative response/methylated-DNA-[protein]-cysteine methyltransferase
LGGALNGLRNGATTARATHDSGYESESGFRDAFRRIFGTTPGRPTKEGCMLTTMIPSPLGPLLAGATEAAVCLLEFTDRRAIEAQIKTLRKRFPIPITPGRNPLLDRLEKQLAEYLAGKRRDFDLPLDYPGTDFQTRVWDALRTIPCGRTWSYEQLARTVGRPGAQRAVGRANGENRIAILIPCHRVVNKSGKLGGYGGGLWRKQFLLDLERGESAGGALFEQAGIRAAD